eukprot:TRINITY_DN380_c0_g1_i1.p1 TRINITY_DN380_c0_g1~~TRINITY_DN380_c0_g1_i1.p1  ORF type:complete len:132 (+),score=27.30 TRINITY_DN380_c0_g1_i1:480-875(+)
MTIFSGFKSLKRMLYFQRQEIINAIYVEQYYEWSILSFQFSLIKLKIIFFQQQSNKKEIILSSVASEIISMEDAFFMKGYNFQTQETLQFISSSIIEAFFIAFKVLYLRGCLLYTSPSPRDVEESRMPSSA